MTPEDLQTLNDTFDKWLSRGARPDEIANLDGKSQWQIEKYLINNQDAKLHSHQYRQRAAQINQASMDIWGFQWDPAAVDEWVRDGATDPEIFWYWRNTDAYKQMFPDKPTGMSEAEYRKASEDMAVNKRETQDLWYKWTGQQMTQPQLHQIFYGGPDAAGTRARYNEITNIWEPADKKMVARGLNFSTTKPTAAGPTAPLLGGRVAAIPKDPYGVPQEAGWQDNPPIIQPTYMQQYLDKLNQGVAKKVPAATPFDIKR